MKDNLKVSYIKTRMKLNKDLLKEVKKQPFDFYQNSSNEITEKYKNADFTNKDYANPKDLYMESLNPDNNLGINDGKKVITVNNLKPIEWCKEHHKPLFENIIIHIHGGAFIGQSSGGVMNYVFPWVKV